MPEEASLSNRRGLTESVTPVHLAGYRGWIIQRDLGKGFCSALASFLASGMTRQQAIKTRRGSDVYQFKDQGRVFFLKRYPITGIKACLQCFVGQNKARKSWRIGRAMLDRGLSTPLPVFYIHRRISFLKSEHIVGTQDIQESTSLREYVQQHFKPGRSSLAQKRHFVEKLAEFIGRLHQSGIYHGDLTARNILVKPIDNVQKAHIYLIDLDSIRSTRWISSRRRIKNLDELGRNFLDLDIVGTLDRARFLKHYLKVYIKEKRTYRAFLEVVRKRTAYRLKRHGQEFYRTDLPDTDRS